ncbi:MAG: hypothetical protein FWD78_17865 [Treponema sp.]|nr:hypothetical protein [Treponema sp.]
MDKKLFLLAELDDNSQSLLRNIEKSILQKGIIGTQTKNIPYHITLSEYSMEKEGAILELLKKVKDEFKVFDISYSSLGLFGLRVLFANPDMNVELIRLYDFVKGNSLHKDDPLSAHTTLLIDEPENIIKVLPDVAKSFTKISGKITAISLYEFFPERFIKRIDLESQNYD